MECTRFLSHVFIAPGWGRGGGKGGCCKESNQSKGIKRGTPPLSQQMEKTHVLTGMSQLQLGPKDTAKLQNRPLRIASHKHTLCQAIHTVPDAEKSKITAY